MSAPNQHSVPWDELGVTEDALPDCVAAIRREPSSRHPFLLHRLVTDHQWHAAGGGRDASVMAVMLAVFNSPDSLHAELLEALKALCDKLAVVGPAITNAFHVALVHGSSYDGPNYEAEYRAARAAISRATPGEQP